MQPFAYRCIRRFASLPNSPLTPAFFTKHPAYYEAYHFLKDIYTTLNGTSEPPHLSLEAKQKWHSPKRLAAVLGFEKFYEKEDCRINFNEHDNLVRLLEALDNLENKPQALDDLLSGLRSDKDEQTEATKGPQIGKLKTIDNITVAFGNGSRKTSKAFAVLIPKESGWGSFLVNGRSLHQYFSFFQCVQVLKPFINTKTLGHYNAWCFVLPNAGGPSGQAGALRLALSQCIAAFHGHQVLGPLLMRDTRERERKKPGQKRAHKKFRWVRR